MAAPIVFFSNHVFDSRRKAGFHFLAEAFAAGGWPVLFVSTGISRLSDLRGDRRLTGLPDTRRNSLADLGGGVSSFVHVPLLHPVRTPLPPWAERMALGGYGRRLPDAVAAVLAEAEIAIFESSAALFFVETVACSAPHVRRVYRVSDDVRVIAMADTIRQREDAVLDRFDLVSLPSRIMARGRLGRHHNAQVHPHGIADSLIAGRFAPPFAAGQGLHAVSVGSTLFDHDFLAMASRARLDIRFHIVGDLGTSPPVRATNVVYYGELPFLEAAAFSAYADIALATYTMPEGAAYLAETSNKIAQYCHFRRPIIVQRPIAEHLGYPNLVPYEAGNAASVAAALTRAAALDTSAVEIPAPPSWQAVRDMILRDLPPGR